MSALCKLAIFASGNGTNAEAIFSYFKNHASINVQLLLSNNADAVVLERAKKYGIECIVFNKSQFLESNEVIVQLQSHHITHVVLAGFLWLMPKHLIAAFPGKIINIHPSLLPKFGGKGMYGMNVHKAVILAGEQETGITIHEVNEHFDQGKIILQLSCPVSSADTPEQIANKIHTLEYQNYPIVIEQWVKSKRDS